MGISNKPIILSLLLLISGLISCSNTSLQAPQGQNERPNILLILADDLGYSDLGAFGSEINTPNIDALARSGTLLTNFHVAPTCSPTRAMLLSGTDNHIAGLGNMMGDASPEQKGQPGYEGYLNFDVVTFVSLLKDAGYHTYMSGKWHLGNTDETAPWSRGFEKVFALLNGGSSHFDHTGMQGIRPIEQFSENGKPASLPKDFYSSAFYTDKLIEYIDQQKDDKPFFAYTAYTAPHWPLHAPDEFIEKYEGVYDVGYQIIQARRLERMKALSIVPEHTSSNPGSQVWPGWEELTPKQKASEIRRMQVYAGMVEALDFHIGRLLNYLRDTGKLENTFIIFLSDNGAEGNNPLDIVNNAEWVPANFDNRLENIGKQGSYTSYGPGWAQVSTTPFRMYKAFPTQGGIISPTIISFPGHIKKGTLSQTFASVLDVAPTLLQLAGTKHPGTNYKGRKIYPLQGNSMLPFLRGETSSIHKSDYVMGWELFNRRSIRQGNWKLMLMNSPWGNNEWELFNLVDDPSEQHNLAPQYPHKVNELLTHWQSYAANNRVIVLDKLDKKWSNSKNYFDLPE